jgi:hypothetical protein
MLEKVLSAWFAILSFLVLFADGTPKCQYKPNGPNSIGKECRAGYYCPNNVVAIRCPAGYFCPPGSCSPLACSCGHKCPRGSVVQITCRPPFYCPGTRNYNQTLCPIASKCDRPAMCTPTPCSPGTFVTCPGKITCDCCSAGRYCPTPTTSLICPEGSYCPACSGSPKPCPQDLVCRLGSSAPQVV